MVHEYLLPVQIQLRVRNEVKAHQDWQRHPNDEDASGDGGYFLKKIIEYWHFYQLFHLWYNP